MSSENHQHQHHSHHHHFYHHNLHIHQRSIFLPMLCSRPSIKDVSLPQSSRDPPGSFSNDPLSPRIGCTGQVKKHNKIAAGLSFSHRFSLTPKSSTTITSTTTPIVKYSKLKRLFSGKSLNTNTTTTATASSCGSSRPKATVKSGDVPKKHRCSRNENFVAISIENMDPPLPVIKRVHKSDEEGSKVDSLWKRRSGGAALKSLQLQQIHHPRHHLQLTSVFDG
ncbi:hypothetical protein RIF29_16830 [Crotalaria pallida]|uniref:Uncharacterized protein n=1 Tax=Crotalaria pallida TaxID=3830 RepID=A0AAN9ICD9_CROPI